MRRFLFAALAALCLTTPAPAQNPGIVANGVIVPGHGVKWLDRLHVQDSGSALPTTFVSSFNTRTGAVVPATNDYSFAQLSSSIACAQYAALTGDITTPAGSCATTLATVNANIGSFGSATQCVAITANAKGLITAASAVTCTPAFSSITGTIATGQVSGSYTGITGVGTLTVGAIGAGFTTTGITAVGTLTAGTLGAGFTTVAVAQGGTGDTGTAWSSFAGTIAPVCGTATITVVAAKFKTLGKTVSVTGHLTTGGVIGTCTSVITLTLPVTPNSAGVLAAFDGNANAMGGCVLVAANANVNCLITGAANFTANDLVKFSGVYESQ